MRERPIIFNGAMVRAILGGCKTQTRRPRCKLSYPWNMGDVLWVRETWRPAGPWECCGARIFYKADGASLLFTEHKDKLRVSNMKWRPSIHMPRWAARIFLRVNRVWVERVQDIGIEDIHANGIERWRDYEGGQHLSVTTARNDFHRLWNSLYGETYPWDSNPFVWACEFEVLEKPRDYNG